MADPPPDPYDWSIDQVITEIAASDLPLAESLRINEVDGEVLLTVCTYERLKSDIGIISMGKRSKVMRAIDILRRRSSKYRDYITDLACNTALPEDSSTSVWDSPVPGVGFFTPAMQKGIRPLDVPLFSTPTNPRKRKSGALNNPLTPLHPLTPLNYSSATPEPVKQLSETPTAELRTKKATPLSLLSSDDDPLFVPNSALHFRDHAAVRIVRNKDTGSGEAVPFLQVLGEIDEAEVDEVDEVERGGFGMEVEYDSRLRSPRSSSPAERFTGDQSSEARNSPMDTSPEPIIAREDDYRSREQEDDDFEVVGVNNNRKESTVSPLKKTKGASRKCRYLPPKALTVDELIYGKLEVGDEIFDEEYDDEDFTIVSTNKFPGQQRYVERQIRHLLQNTEPVTSVHKGHLRTGLKTYKKDLVLKHYHQSITLFSVQEDGFCRVTKENTFTINLLPDVASRTIQTSSDVQVVRFADESNKKQQRLNKVDNSVHDWDYLLKWQNIDDDKELPPIGESESENEYSLETWEELGAESGAPLEKPVGRSSQKPLTTQEIREVLREGEQVIIDNWRKRILPRKETQAWRIYRAAKKRRERKKTARDARLRIKDLNERLEKMRDEIVGVGWTHKAHVKKQVGILQLTLIDREEQKWTASLMERKKAPERPMKAIYAKEFLVGKDEEMLDYDDGDDEDDGESLGSTSEGDYASDDDDEGMEGFIVADNERDFVNGVELEVEGEKEVEEELARKATENELIDSDGSEDVPTRARRSKESRKAGDPEEEEGEEEEEEEEEEEDQFMTGMGDDVVEDVEMNEENAVVPKLDKGKGRANLESVPPPNFKEEPQATQVFSSPTSGPSARKDIPIIDLTMDDSPQNSPQKSWKLKKRLSDIPQYDLRGDDGEEKRERVKSQKKLLKELVEDTDGFLREAIWFRLKEFQTPASLAGLFDTVTAIARQLHQAKFKNVPGLDEYGSQSRETVDEIGELKGAITRYNAKIYRTVASIYVAWVLGITDTTKKLTPDKYKAIHSKKKFRRYRIALIESLKPHCESEDPKEDTSDPITPLGKSKGKKKSRAVDIELEKSDDETTPSGHRKRNSKPLVEDAEAKENRDRLKQRMKARADRERAEKKRAMLSGVYNQNPDKIRVNLGKYVKHNDIFFHDFFAKHLKPHQVEGIRFMWQQLIQTGENRGALLAHTMGLGKTLQVIALLYTIATAAGSDDKKTFEQIPEHLRTSKTLILSPPGLVENWCDEFHRWLPTKPDNPQELDLKDIGPITRADGTVRPEDRLLRIENWYEEGGVLLMGYQAFRSLIFNVPPLPTEQHQRIKDMLHKGPNIIIADEAHQLKNPAAKLSDAARGFASMSRIAMTGSPLSNNLLEYWSMIDWIDPGFLGPRKEFEQKYVQPIEDGLYADSGHAEKRKCLKMLRVLKQDIGPKVHRMDISVIEHDLPAKTEFLIKVPLSELQLEMYRRFLKDPTTTGQIPGQIDIQGISGRKFFDAIHLLSLICNHPLAFVETLEMREKNNQTAKAKKQEKPEKQPILEDDSVDFDDLDDLLSETKKPYPWAREVMDTVGDEMGLEHSYKMLLVKIIVDNAIKAKDQTLIFTHSVSTLAFLERQLKQWGTSFQKLDGRTAMNMRQAMTKRFNSGGSDVCLISTEAGGLGLNLPGANRIIIFDFKWSPMWEEQAIGRAFRLGQKKHVFVYRFHACGTYEEIMRNKVLFKNQLHSRVVDKKDPMRYATKNGKQYFNEPYDVPKEDLAPFKGMDPYILDKIITQVDFIRAIENTQTFQGDIEDTLTEEEIRESDELLQAEQQMRKAQGLGDDTSARKADNEYRRLNVDPPKITRQLEMQIEQERKTQESRLIEQLARSNNLPAPLSPLDALSLALMPSKTPASTTKAHTPTAKTPVPTAKTPAPIINVPTPLVKSKAPPPPPGPDEFVAPLPPTTAGRTKSMPDPTPKVAQKEKDKPLSNASSTINTDAILALPGPIQKITIPSPAKSASGNGPPSLSDSTNKFGLSISGLPKIFGGKSKRSPDNSDNSDTGGSKKAKVSPAVL